MNSSLLEDARQQLRDELSAGRIEALGDSSLSLNCSRCGRPYREHPHSFIEGAERSQADPRYHPNHAFRTQPHVGRLLHPRSDGLVYEPDGRWDS